MERLSLFLLVLGVGTLAATAAAPAQADDDDTEAKRRRRRNEIVEVVEKTAPAVVSVGTTKLVPVRYFDWEILRERRGNRELKGLGSGVVVHPSGLVITNAHVINEADQVVVRLTGVSADATEIPATIVAADLAHDLALLRLERPGPYAAAAFGRSSDLMPGETVIAIGSPVGLGRTVTTGVVSALDRSITIQDRTFDGLVQTDAAVNQGNSGGALLNVLGEWVGVNSAIFSLSGGGSDGISFAIPMEKVNAFLERAVASGRVSGVWIGASFEERRPGDVRVRTVYPVGPAAAKEVPAGARVLEVGGRRVATLADATLALVDATRTGGVDLVYESGGAARRVRLAFDAPPTEKLAWRRLGLRAAEVTPEVRLQTGYPVGSGIVVTDVREDGPASRVGLQPGDLLLSLGAQNVRAEEDLLEFVQLAPTGEAAPVKLVRPVRTRFGVTADTWKAKLVPE